MNYQIHYKLAPDLDWVWYQQKSFLLFTNALVRAHLMYDKEPLEIRIVDKHANDVCTFHKVDKIKIINVPLS